MIQPFHLAIPVNDLQKAEEFYGGIMNFSKGRSSDHWIDWNCYGHQLVTHLDKNYDHNPHVNAVDGKQVPVPHFGVVLSMDDWELLSQRLQEKGVEFIIEPYIRFKGETGEQATMFLLDPSGNALEFKAFEDMNQLFAY